MDSEQGALVGAWVMSERIRHPQEVLIMFSIVRSSSLVVVGAVAVGLSVAVTVPAMAVPAPEPGNVTVTACPVGMDGLTARLRSAGLSAQAANVATNVTYYDCLRSATAR